MIIVILVFALILRFFNLNQSLWLDEAVQAVTAKESFFYIFQEIIGDFHPPLYHFLIHFWVRVFGSSEIALRMPSVLFGTGTVWIIYKIINKLTNSKTKNIGLIAALFMATAPFHIYYSQEGRMYSMTCFFASLSMFFFIKNNNKEIKEVKRSFVLWFVSTALLIYSDYFGFLILLAQVIVALFRKNFKFLTACFFVLVTYIPWLPMLMKQLQIGIAATAAFPEWGKLINLSFFKALPLTFIKFSIGRITIFNKTLYFLVALGLMGVYGLVSFWATLKIIKAKDYEKKGFVILVWLVLPVVIAWAVSLFIPNYQPFRLLLVLPAFYLLLVFGISTFNNKTVRSILASFVVLVNLCSVSVYYRNSYFHREDWRGVSKYVTDENSAVLLPSQTSDWPLKFYDTKNKLRLIYGSEGINKVSDESVRGLFINQLTNYDKIFYIRYLVPLFDPQEKILSELENSNYSKIKETSFNQIEVWEYEK
jgi:uncharacterized membrane protein